MEDFNIKLGKRLRELREKLGFTREKLAEHADTSSNYLGEIERGQVNVSAAIINKIAISLDVPLSELFLFEHHRSRLELETNIIELIKNANDKDIEKIYRMLITLLR